MMEAPKLELPAWNGARHLAALRRHIVTGPVPGLDVQGYAAELLERTDVPEEEWAELTPRVLAWALCPEQGRAEDDGRFIVLGCGTRIRMGDCSWSDRVEAACDALGVEVEDADPIRVVEQVLGQVLAHADVAEPLTLDQLSAPSLVQLAAAVLDRYDRALTDEDLELLDLRNPEEAPEQARMVLAVHRSLGRLRTPPHSPPRRDQPEPRWPPQSRPPEPPLHAAPF